MKKIILKKYNNIFLYVDTTYEIDQQLKKYMSVMIENAWFHPKYKQGIWDGKISFYDNRNHLLPIGLLSLFYTFCKYYEYNYIFDFDKNILYTKISDEKLKLLYKKLFEFSEYVPRNYQKEAINNAIKNKRGIVLSPTGSGKSLIIYVLIRYLLFIKREVLLVVPTTHLCEQMFSDFKDYGWKALNDKVCILYGGQYYDESKPVLISTWQSLQNKEIEFFDRFGGLMIDECFHPKSLISTIDGKKKIKELQIGDLVKSKNEETGKIEYKPIEKIYKNLNNVKELYYIEDENGKLYFEKGVTGNHKIKTISREKQIIDLKEGDKLVNDKKT